MALLDRFLPAWRHRDPEVRATAVRDLGHESQHALISVARTDGEPRIRRIAIKKVTDVDVLLEIARTDSNDELRTLASARAEESQAERAASDRPVADCLHALQGVTRPSHRVTIATRATHSEVRRAVLAAVADEHSLAEIARRGNDAEIGLAAVARITDAALLQRIASRDAPSEVALAAVTRIDNPTVLQAIADDPQAPKHVRKQARARSAVLLGDDHPIRVTARRERQNQLCTVVERLLSVPDPSAGLDALRAAEHDWAELSSPAAPDPTLEERFRRACASARESLIRAEQQREVEVRRVSAREQRRVAQQQLCETVEAINGAETPAAVATARAAWRKLAASDDPASRELDTRFALALERCQQRYERWQARDAFCLQLQALVLEAERLVAARDPRAAVRPRAALERRWATLVSSPAGVKWSADERALERRFVDAGEALAKQDEELRSEHQQRERAARTHLSSVCQRLEALAQRDTITSAAVDRATMAADEAAAHLRILPATERETLRERLTQARHALMQRAETLAVTDDWKRWANAEVQETLIQRAEALLASNDPLRMLHESRSLDEEWAGAAVAPRDKSRALWERFRTARRELRRRNDAYLADNLEKKEALCRAVEGLADSTDWNAAASAIRRMQEEWKQIGPVRQQLSAALFARFRAPANRFFERHKEYRRARKEQYEERLGRMRELCEKGEALADSTDWEATAAQMKELQRGALAVWGRRPAPSRREGETPRETDVLRQRFTAASDRFFDRYRQRDVLELDAKIAGLEAILTDLDSLRLDLAQSEPAAAADFIPRLKDRLGEWVRAGQVPPERAMSLNQRLQAACDAIEAAYPGGFPDGAVDAESNLPQREKLCDRLERLVESIDADTGQPEDVAETLKRALAARTIGGPARSPREQARHEAREAAERLRDKWQRLGPVIGPRARTLAERFAKADASVTELCGR